MMSTFKVVSDLICPWCYIGKKRLERAIDQLSDSYEVEVKFQPFELNPTMPKSGRDQREYLAAKFGGEERYDQITNHTAGVAAKEGLQFDFESQKISPNTFDAHRMIWLAEKHGVKPLQIALAWVIEKNGIIAIPKAAKEQHILENAEAAILSFTDEELNKLDAAFPKPTAKVPLDVI